MPPWNGRDRGQPISEEAEREEVEEVVRDSATSPDSLPAEHAPSPLATFTIKLGEAYYDQGLINPGVDASKLLGNHGEPIQILFENETDPILSSINRTANRNWSVRVIGRNSQIASWFQRHFLKGEVVTAQVLDANRVLLLAESDARSSTRDHLPKPLKWERDGSLCPICEGRGRNSVSYPGALCRRCEEELVDDKGRRVTTWNTNPLGSGVGVETSHGISENRDVAIYARGIVWWAREARFGGVAVQPVEIWETAYSKVSDEEF